MANRTGELSITNIREYLGVQATQKELKRIYEEVIPLIRSISRNQRNAASLSHAIVNEFIVKDSSRDLDIIDKILFVIAYAASGQHIPGYATLDSNHIKDIDGFIDTIKRYANDSSQKRPLVFLMLASPGAGKSHFIKCIANQLESVKVGAITYNMAGQQSNEDLIPPLDSARNLKVGDRIPLLFLDEFDSSPDFTPMLLPLLWDGELTIGPRDLKLGKVIIVLAGSHPNLPETMEDARSMRRDTQITSGQSQKIVDLLSRINGGVIRIPSFNDVANSIDRRVDKVCIIIDLLRQRFGNQLAYVPLSLLRFVAQADFRYGVRSIAHLVSTIPYKDNLRSLS